MNSPVYKKLGFCGMIPVLLLLSTGIGNAAGEEEDPSRLTLDRIFTRDDFRSERFGPARWLQDGSGYTTLEKSADKAGGRDIVRCDPASGEAEILVSAARLTPEGSNTPLEISDYNWSEDGRRLLVFTNTTRVWRYNTRGDYWVLDLENGRLRQLGGDAEPSTLMFAKFSSDATRVGYVRENDIYVEDLSDGKITRLTTGGSATLINGTFDWVYEEEFGLRDGFRWSPDGKHIAYWQIDSSVIQDYFIINNTDTLYPKITAIKYPKVGVRNSSCRIGVVSAAGGDTRWIDFPGDPHDHYLARMDWASRSDELILQRLNRLQNRNQVVLADIRTGRFRTVFTDRDDAWVEVVDDLRWFKEGEIFTWVSEKDGWKHVYLISRSGDSVTCITPGDYDVESIRCIDEKGGYVYFIAAPRDPTRRYLFRVPVTGADEPERLTPIDQPGTHAYQVSPDGKWAIHTASSFGEPPIIDLVRLPNHESVRILVGNDRLRGRVHALDRGKSEFFRVDIGNGIEFDAWCMKPPDFDPTKKYPVLFYVYGEPASSTVRDNWGGGGYLWHLMLTQRGYLVMSVDNRGTKVPRGREWRKCIYRQVGVIAPKDQAAAVRAIVAERPYVDSDRIGIWGWSGGGQMSLNAIFKFPEIYSTAMAVAFVSDQRLYDTIYQERYMGLPRDNPEGFRDGSPINFAHQLKGNLLIVHGTADDNVHYQSFERLINELIRHNKPFTMMSYPNRSHGIREGENTTRHLRELLTRYLKENMPPGPVK